MAMSSSDLFLLRAGLIEAGMKETAAEKVATAMESSVALTIDQVLQKWTAEVKQDIAALRIEVKHDLEVVQRDVQRDLEVVQRDMKLWLFGVLTAFTVTTVGLVLGGMRLFM